MRLFKELELLWIIVSPEYTTKIEFKLNFIEKWILERAFKKHKVKIIKNDKIIGRTYNTVFVDEIKEWK